MDMDKVGGDRGWQGIKEKEGLVGETGEEEAYLSRSVQRQGGVRLVRDDG